MPNDTILSPEKLRLLNQLKPFISRNPQILRMNESQFEHWKSKSPTTEGISYNDIQLYKEHTPLERTIYQAPRPGISPEEKPKITSLRQIKTSSQLAQWLSDYKKRLPQNVQQRIFLSRDDLAQKNVFYVKLWDQVRTLIPPEEFLKLEEVTKSAKTENEVFNAFIYWRNHLANRNLQLMLPDELAEAYRFWQIKHTMPSQQETAQETEIFRSPTQPFSNQDAETNKPPEKTHEQARVPQSELGSQEKYVLPKEEIPSDQPTFITNEIAPPSTAATPIGLIEERPFSIPPESITGNPAIQLSESVPSLPRETIPYTSGTEGQHPQTEQNQQDQQNQNNQQSNRTFNPKNAYERYKDIKNPQRVIDRAQENINNLRGRANNVRSTGRNIIQKGKKLLKFGGEGTVATEGGVVAGEGVAAIGGGGAAIGGIGLGTILLIILAIVCILFVIILVVILVYAIWIHPGDRFQRIIVQKSVDKTQIPNPADAKSPDDTKVTFTISATYDKKSQGILVTDVVPDNAVFASAEGQFTAYDASGTVVSDPNTHQESVKKIVWTVTNADYTPTGSSAPADFPAGWPTSGQITQGPRGGTDHADLYNRTKAESIDIAYLATTPEYATFDGIVDTADFSCGNCNAFGDQSQKAAYQNAGSPGYGNHVILTNKDKTFQVYYGHLLPQPLVTKGQQVKRGDVIGYMGSTGYSTGSHLHYEFRNLSLAPPYIPEAINPDNCDPDFNIPCQPASITYAPITSATTTSTTDQTAQGYWFQLHRSRANGKQPTEDLYLGPYGDVANSKHIMTSVVNPGVDSKSPTPRPDLLGKSYWIITKKEQNQGEAINLMGPDFLVLNIEYQNEFNGPLGYNECGPSRNTQCFWPTPGEFGLHGTGDTSTRLTDSGSSGCIRHSNDSITSIYNLLKNESGEIRYYISED